MFSGDEMEDEGDAKIVMQIESIAKEVERHVQKLDQDNIHREAAERMKSMPESQPGQPSSNGLTEDQRKQMQVEGSGETRRKRRAEGEGDQDEHTQQEDPNESRKRDREGDYGEGPSSEVIISD